MLRETLFRLVPSGNILSSAILCNFYPKQGDLQRRSEEELGEYWDDGEP